jgi:hypothetical protein
MLDERRVPYAASMDYFLGRGSTTAEQALIDIGFADELKTTIWISANF